MLGKKAKKAKIVKKELKKDVSEQIKADKVIIMGASGRDWHNFLMYFKNNPCLKVVAFTASQIPGIEKRVFPKELAGPYYTEDIPIYPEEKIIQLIKDLDVKHVYLCYSDLSFQEVMEKASEVLAAGANFSFLGTRATTIKTNIPLISITAVRTGAGKSQTSRKVGLILKELGYKVVAIRHPMPYGDLRTEVVQRFAKYDDLKKHQTTIEEREEYEPWIRIGIPVYAGVDYQKILERAEQEADIIIWDGGNNDFSFYKPDLSIVVADPLRAGHERSYYPGLINLINADVVVINKVDHAKRKDVRHVIQNIRKFNLRAKIIKANSIIKVENPDLVAGKSALLVEDGPTLTHGGMKFGAARIAALTFKAKIVNAKEFAVGSIKETFDKYPHLDMELPAMGYSKQQIKDLQDTINRAKCDIVLDGSPVNLKKLIKTNKPIIDVTYELEEIGKPDLKMLLRKHFQG